MGLTCYFCGVELTGGIDTFGPPTQECCDSCWRANGIDDEPRSWYGLAPHHHDMDITGSIIGSTVFDGIPEDNRDEDGWYQVAPGLFFLPDVEAPGCGIWEDRRK